MPTSSDRFNDIRPYNDDEIQPAILRVINSDEFIEAIVSFRFSKIAKYTGFLLKPLLRRYFLYKWGAINSIDEMQQVMGRYMQHMIASTTTKFSFSGVEELDADKNYLFVSNHRDIAMDPAFVNWALFTENLKTVRIAIGDNLLSKPFSSDLMRMNKSFIVKRALKAPREMMKAVLQLSDYIFSSLQNESSIWIAQKEGRAKDGFDQTDPALLKMLQLNGRKQKKEFGDYIKELKIVPVSISYQYEPCAIAKAKELYHKQHHGEYVKSAGEDIASIVEGFSTAKGHVHLAFGQPIESKCDSAEELAKTIDRQIVDSFYLHPGNYIAGGCKEAVIDSPDTATFEQRLACVPEELKPLVLAMYAKPFHRKAEINTNSCEH